MGVRGSELSFGKGGGVLVIKIISPNSVRSQYPREGFQILTFAYIGNMWNLHSK